MTAPVSVDTRERRYRLSLAVSGGGFRAMLFHTGLCERLAELGLLAKVEMLSTVSGGSLVAGLILAQWDEAAGSVSRFRELVTNPLVALSRRGLRPSKVELLLGAIIPGPVRFRMRRRVEAFLPAGRRRLVDLPKGPDFAINATDLRAGARWEFSRRRMGSYQSDYAESRGVRIADAVLASAAFPGALPWWVFPTPRSGKVALGDGGIYDNLGLEPVWDESRVVIVSDAEHPLGTWIPRPAWGLSVLKRSIHIGFDQVAKQRRRMLVARLKGDCAPGLDGVTIRIGHHAREYDHGAPAEAYYSEDEAKRLASTRTDIDRFGDGDIASLVYHGYSLGDAAVRRWVPKELLPAVVPEFTRRKP